MRTVGGPYFEDVEVGQVFGDAPGLTLTAGHAALHQAIVGDRLRLALDADLCRAVTGHDAPLAHPNLVCDVAIGQSSVASHRVRANLFYRGLVLRRPVFVGDTLRSRTEVVALKQNRRRPGVPATGLVVLHVTTTTAAGDTVLDFWRCPMIPLHDEDRTTGHADDLSAIPHRLDRFAVHDAVPQWDLAPLREAAPGPHGDELGVDDEFAVDGGETVSAAPELARLTLNLAMAHTDPTSTQTGRRLVYGGHTIAVAAAHATRALPAMATILAWEGCDHTGPVHEEDVLRTRLRVLGVEPLADGALVTLQALVVAEDATSDQPRDVLDWRFVALVA